MAKNSEKKQVRIEGLFTSVEVREDNLVIKIEDGLGTTETEVVIDFAGGETVEEVLNAVKRLRECYPDEDDEIEDQE